MGGEDEVFGVECVIVGGDVVVDVFVMIGDDVCLGGCGGFVGGVGVFCNGLYMFVVEFCVDGSGVGDGVCFWMVDIVV